MDKKDQITIIIIVALTFSLQTIGFDLYHHSMSLWTFDSISELNYDHYFLDFKIPRYLLFHYLSYLFTLIGIPSGILFLLTQCYVIITLLKYISNTNVFNYYTITFLSFGLTLFWAPISLGTLMLITYYFNRKRTFLFFGCILHPVTLILGVFLGLATKKWKTILAVIVVLLTSILILNNIYVFPKKCSSVIIEYRDLNEMSIERILKVVIQKWREMLVFSLVILLGYLSKKKINKRLNSQVKIRQPIIYSLLFLGACLFSLNKQIYHESPGILSINLYDYNSNLNEIITRTWLNVGYNQTNKACDASFFRWYYNN